MKRYIVATLLAKQYDTDMPTLLWWAKKLALYAVTKDSKVFIADSDIAVLIDAIDASR